MNLFVAPLEKVSERDISDFLGLRLPEAQRLSEGPRLDFSEFLPDGIGEDVASLANATGGLIFLGVACDKAKQNIPVALVGLPNAPDLGTQVASKVDATVRPRPDFEIKTVETASGHYVVIVRVKKGSYPPYEYQRGDKVRIPLRVHDRKRNATLRDIEGLLRERSVAGTDPESSILKYVNASDFDPKKTERVGGGTRDVGDYDFHRIVVVPIASAVLRLDVTFEREFERLVLECFPHESQTRSHHRRGDYFQIDARKEHAAGRWHHLWRVYRNGVIGYTGTLAGDFPGGKPIGDLVFDLLATSILADKIFRKTNISGDVYLGHFVRAPNANFLAKFPAPDMFENYDSVGGIRIPQPNALNTDRSFSYATLDTTELSVPDAQIGELIMYNLAELQSISFNYGALMEAIRGLGARTRKRLKLD